MTWTGACWFGFRREKDFNAALAVVANDTALVPAPREV